MMHIFLPKPDIETNNHSSLVGTLQNTYKHMARNPKMNNQ